MENDDNSQPPPYPYYNNNNYMNGSGHGQGIAPGNPPIDPALMGDQPSQQEQFGSLQHSNAYSNVPFQNGNQYNPHFFQQNSGNAQYTNAFSNVPVQNGTFHDPNQGPVLNAYMPIPTGPMRNNMQGPMQTYNNMAMGMVNTPMQQLQTQAPMPNTQQRQVMAPPPAPAPKPQKSEKTEDFEGMTPKDGVWQKVPEWTPTHEIMLPFTMKCFESDCQAILEKGETIVVQRDLFDDKLLKDAYTYWFFCFCGHKLQFKTSPRTRDYIAEDGFYRPNRHAEAVKGMYNSKAELDSHCRDVEQKITWDDEARKAIHFSYITDPGQRVLYNLECRKWLPQEEWDELSQAEEKKREKLEELRAAREEANRVARAAKAAAKAAAKQSKPADAESEADDGEDEDGDSEDDDGDEEDSDNTSAATQAAPKRKRAASPSTSEEPAAKKPAAKKSAPKKSAAKKSAAEKPAAKLAGKKAAPKSAAANPAPAPAEQTAASAQQPFAQSLPITNPPVSGVYARMAALRAERHAQQAAQASAGAGPNMFSHMSAAEATAEANNFNFDFGSQQGHQQAEQATAGAVANMSSHMPAEEATAEFNGLNIPLSLRQAIQEDDARATAGAGAEASVSSHVPAEEATLNIPSGLQQVIQEGEEATTGADMFNSTHDLYSFFG